MSKSSESQNVEWKSSWHDDYLKWICGFANAQGGRLYLGKNDRGQVVGLTNARKMLEMLPNKIRDQLGIMPQVNLLHENEKFYLEILVEPSSVPISIRGAYYLRSGSTKQELKGQALNDFLLKKMGVTWDRAIELNATLDDIDPNAINIFKNDAKKAGRLPDLSDLSISDILKRLRLLTREGFTRASLVLFGKDPGEFYPNLFVKIGRFGRSDADLRFQEVCEGNLVMMLRNVIEQLEKKFLTKPIRFEGLQRIEELEYPLAALREILLNALVHRNYLGSMTQLKVYDDRLTFWNAGQLPEELSIKQLFKSHESIPRNPLIAEVCYKAGYIDTWGRGVEKITEACRDRDLPSPRILERSGGILVELKHRNAETPVENAKTPVKKKKTPVETPVENAKTPVKKKTPPVETPVDNIRTQNKANLKTSELIVVLINSNPHLTLSEIAKKIGKSLRAVERAAKKLRKENRIKFIGPRKGGYWEVFEKSSVKD